MDPSYIPPILFAFGSKIVPLVFLCASVVIFRRKKSVPTAAFLLGCLVATVAPYILFSTMGASWLHVERLVMAVAYLLQCTGLLFYALSMPKTSA